MSERRRVSVGGEWSDTNDGTKQKHEGVGLLSSCWATTNFQSSVSLHATESSSLLKSTGGMNSNALS